MFAYALYNCCIFSALLETETSVINGGILLYIVECDYFISWTLASQTMAMTMKMTMTMTRNDIYYQVTYSSCTKDLSKEQRWWN